MDTTITHIRPRFRFTVPFKQEEVMVRISKLIVDAGDELNGKIHQNHVTLDIPDRLRHYWSPQLNFRIEQDYDNPEHTTIKGLIGPRPTVWTMFMFIYFSIGVIGFVLTIYGISQYLLGETTIWVYALPVTVVLMLTAYQTGKYGENLGKEQIEYLKQFVRDALEME